MHRHKLTGFEAGQEAVIRTILDSGSLAIPYLAAAERHQEFLTKQDQSRTFGQPAARNASTSLLSQARQRAKGALAALSARLQPAHAADMGNRTSAPTAPLRLL